MKYSPLNKLGKYSNKIHTNSCVKDSLTEPKCVKTILIFFLYKISCTITNHLNKAGKWTKIMLQ